MALLDELKARDVHQTGHWELKSGRHAETYLQCTIAMGDPAFARRIGRQLADELRDLDANVVCAPGVSSMILGFVVADALACRMLWFEEGRRGHGLRRGIAAILVFEFFTEHEKRFFVAFPAFLPLHPKADQL